MTDFAWPWEFSFPPFFTLQPNEETRKQQINVWADLFLKYLKHSNKYVVNVHENSLPLFCNEAINRRLSEETILLVLEQLQRTGHAVPLDKARVEWLVYPYTLEEYGNMIYNWVQQTGQVNSVCTLFEIISVEETEATSGFQGIDERVLLNVLRKLQDKGRCELIEMDDSHGVKFF